MGFAAHESALIIASRLPDAGPADYPMSVENVTDKESGLSLQMREWYDPSAGARHLTCTVMYGVAVGNAAALHRITSA